MNKIDCTNFRPFEIGTLFEIAHPSARSIKNYKEGSVPFVSSGAFNNGVVTCLEPKDSEKLDKGGCITVSPLDGASFYQANDFLGRGGSGASISMLYNSHLTEYSALYICTIIKNTAKNFGYSDLLNGDNLKKLKIMLPVTRENTPDWLYMEQYIKGVEKHVSNILTALQEVRVQKSNTTVMQLPKWKPFVVKELFEIRPTKSYKLINKDLLDDGCNPVVVNSAYNNGIGGFSSQPCTEKGGIITFSDTVDANTIFYQENDFIGYSHVQGVYPIGIYKEMWTRNSLLFFVTIFKVVALSKGFDYENKFRRDIAENLEIALPIDIDGNPDWSYMEQYMREREKKAVKVLDLLAS